jgi:hypothetical protein
MHRPRRSASSRCAPAPEQCDRYGLLVPVATVSTRCAAAQVSGLLAGYAIRCTVVPATTVASTGSTEGKRWDVVVFPEDGAAAHRVLSTTLPEP